MTTHTIRQKHLEQEMRLSEKRQILLADHAMDVIWTLTLDGTFTYVSPSVKAVHGMTPREFMERPFDEMFTPESLDLARKTLDDARSHIEQGLPFRIKGLVLHERRKDGSLFWSEVNAVSMVDHDGAFNGILGFTRDITDRVKAEEALRRSEERFRLLAENARDVVWTMELNGTITYVSPSILHVRGITPEEAMHQPLEEILLPESAAKSIAYMQMLAQAAQRNEPLPSFRDDLAYYRKDGSILWTEVIVLPVLRPDGRVELLGVTRDISERKKAEQLIRENQERLAAAERAAMVGELAGGIAHNFNNLLMVVNGNAEMLGRTLPDDDVRKSDVLAIIDAGTRAATLTHQLLAFGRRQSLRPAEIALQPFISAFLPVLQNICGINVSLAITDVNRAGMVSADENQLKKSLMTLVANARDATPEGGRVTISSGRITFSKDDPRLKPGHTPGDYAYLAVNDRGAPIPPEILAHVFEPFFASKHLQQRYDLGLASVEGSVGQSGGFVEAASSASDGNTFTIFLPGIGEAVAVDKESTSTPAAEQLPGHGESVLLVDDDIDVRKITRRLLTRLGYRVIEAESGEEALKIFRDDPSAINFVATDVVMPSMSGQELARKLRLLRSDLPVLFMSGFSPEELFPEGMPSTGMSFLAKPFTIDAIANQLNALNLKPSRKQTTSRPRP